MAHGWIAPTSYPYPFALVKRGGSIDGNRPFTRMAFIIEAVAEQGHIVAYKALIGNSNLAGWTKHARHIEPGDVVMTWRSRPTKAAIGKAKRKLATTISSTV